MTMENVMKLGEIERMTFSFVLSFLKISNLDRLKKCK